MQNPSFEGPRQAHVTPGPWQTCQLGQTPDTQPGSWGVTLAPSNGASYIGLVAQYANNDPNSGQLAWQEGASQQLSGPLTAGVEYTFTIDLSNTNATGGGIDPGCAEVQIWGGFGRCDQGQLLWHSNNLTNYDQWRTFTVNFIPTQNFTWFSFIINPLGCSALPYVLIDNITPIQPKTVKADLNLLQGILCNGANTAQIKTTVKGDNTPFTYNWSAPIANRLNDSVYQNLATGLYFVTVTDSKGCTSRDSIFIPQPDSFTLKKRLVFDANCFGTGGSALLQYTGATPRLNFPYYSYSWDNGSLEDGTQTPLSVGWYHLTVTDSNNCIKVDSVEIVKGAGFTTDTIIRTTNCLSPSNNIDIVVTPHGGAPFTYLWNTSPVQTDSIANNLNTGSYSVTISDNIGCKDTLLFNVTLPPKGVFFNPTKTDIKCFGQSTGVINTNVVSLNPIASYTWSPNVSSSGSASNLAAGIYTITATDITGCFDTMSIEIKQPLPITDSTFVYNIRCFGKTSGYIDVDISGGVMPYTYLWNTVPAQTDSIAKSLGAGNYSVTVTDSNSCQYIISKTITQPAQALSSVSDSSVLKCFGDTTAFLNITLSGGTPGYFYEWTTDTSYLGNTPQINHLGAGTYYVRGIDNYGCNVNDTFTIIQPAPFKHPDFTAPNLCQNLTTAFTNTTDTSGVSSIIRWVWNFGDNATDTIFNPNHHYTTADSFNVKLIANTNGCFDSITKKVKTFFVPNAQFTLADVCQKNNVSINNNSTIGGGTMLYDWDFGDLSLHSNSSSSPISHGYSTAGTYTVLLTLTSDSGCIDTSSKSVNIFKNYIADFSATKVCETDSTYFLNNTDTTGNVALTWTWNYGDASLSNVFQQNHLYGSGGNYNVQLKVSSSQGCSDSITKTIRVDYKPSANFIVFPICQRDTLFINDLSSIGSGTYTHNWDFGDGTTSTVIPAKHKYSTFGNYTVAVTLTSDSGCVDTLSKVVHVGKNNTVAFNALAVCEGNATSFNNTTDSTGSGGVNWLWNFGDNTSSNTYSATHNYSTGGTYSVLLTATTVDGCIDSLRKSTRVNFQPHASFTVNPICMNDSLFVNNLSTLGDGTMNYIWNFGDGSTSNAVPAMHKYSTFGDYTVSVTITSDSGCVDTLSKVVHVGKNNAVTFNSLAVCEGNATSFNNTTDSTGSGGVNWIWNFGDNTSTNTYSASHNYTTGGTYSVLLTATTVDGCIDSLRKETRVNFQPHANFTVADICLNQQSNFNNATSINGGGFSSNWSLGDGSASIQNSPLHTYASFGTFSVLLVVTADSGCVDSIRKTTQVFDVPVANYRVDSVCLGETSSFINQTNTGSFAVQSWAWDLGDGNTDNAPNPNHVYTSAGIFNTSLIVTTTDGCSDTITKTSKVNALPAVTSVVTEESCFNALDGHISLSPIAGQTPFTYYWNSVLGTDALTNIGAGQYTVNYQDANGCLGTQTFDLNPKNEIFIEVTALDVKCFSEKNGYINIFAYGGESGFSYIWNNGSTAASLNNLEAGVYAVTVTDTKGCSLDTTIYINQPPAIMVDILPQDTLMTGSSTPLSITYMSNYANPEFSWTPALGLNCSDCEEPVASPFITTTYQVKMTDSIGCVATDVLTLHVKSSHPLYVPNAFSPNGDGVNDVFNAFTGNYMDFNLIIFNRWGEKIFETSSPGDNSYTNRIGWDGIFKSNLQPPGVYVYEVSIKYLDGVKKRQNGSLTLIR